MRVGFDLGGTKLLGAVIGDTGRVLRMGRRATGYGTRPEMAVDLMLDLAAELDVVTSSVGVGFPGLADTHTGVAQSSVMLDGWRDYALGDVLAERMALSSNRVRVDNDVNCAALAELAARGRAGDQPHSMVFIAVGTGVGGALVLGGQLWRGASGLAGEIGHIPVRHAGDVPCPCGRRGCLGLVASGRAMDADPRRGALALGEALATLMNLLNPALIVLGGGVAMRGEPWLREVAVAARAGAFGRAERACRIELALAGYEAGAIGAALLGGRS